MAVRDTLAGPRKEFIAMAKDFCYPPSVIRSLEMAKNEMQMENIMVSARKRDWKARDITVYACTIDN